MRKHAPDGAARAFDEASSRAEEVTRHPWFRKAARFGHIANGILHILIGLIAWSLAFGSAPEDADQTGAIQLLATNPLGMVLIWLCAAGCVLLGLWHLSEAIWDRQSALDGVKDLGKAVVYLSIGVLFTVAAFGGQQDSGESTSSFSAALMSHPAGAVLLVVTGLVIIGIGGYLVFSGVTQRFMDDLRSSNRREVSRLISVTGTIGYVAKGIVLALVGLLFVVATLQRDPEDATGMDGALRALLDQPFGPVLLAAIGVGLMLFGVFAVMRSRYEA
jgi:Na+/proline symporter